MLTAPALTLTLDDDRDLDWLAPPAKSKLQRSASVGNSWGVTSIGRGFNWTSKMNDNVSKSKLTGDEATRKNPDYKDQTYNPVEPTNDSSARPFLRNCYSLFDRGEEASLDATANIVESPITSPRLSPEPYTQSISKHSQLPDINTLDSPFQRPSYSRSPTSARPRRRSSQQRVSLVAGRLSMVSLETPSPPLPSSPRISRFNSQSSFISVAVSTAPPSPNEKSSFLGGRSISEFVIEGDIGRGAYGLVKRAREMHDDGSLGSTVIIKQIIKSRILADCWKKHPKYGTIPIEIYVMSALSSTKYVLPPRRPWDPKRFQEPSDPGEKAGQVAMGHPNICRLLDFFEDSHYYYLVLPSTLPPATSSGMPPPTDLFDLVEGYPQGLPPDLIRSYLGQLADALCFLHSKGIVHRDVKDENVILGPEPGSCILIDFGSSGILRKNGWDTFSGTLDYAGPEILRGERYYGKEQDVWAFGVVAFVLLIGECPFNTAAEAQEGLESPFSNASIALDERCGEGKEDEGREADGGGALGDAAALVRACLSISVSDRPTFERVLQSKFLTGDGGWATDPDEI